jgi:hypothetical protein
VCHSHPGQSCDLWDGPSGCGPHASDPACTGCAPRPSVPGGLVCVTCWERTTDALIELPELYRDLLSPTRVPAAERVSGGEPEAPLVMADAPRLSRDWLRGVLRHWSLILSRPVRPSTGQLAAALSLLPSQRVPISPPPYGRALSAPTSDEPELTAALILRHADWLLAQEEYADQLVHDISAVFLDARRTAYPSGPAGLLLGLCPILNRQSPEDPDVIGPCLAPVRAYRQRDLVECPGCGTVADPFTWRDWMVTPPDGDGEAVADAYALSTWLSVEHCRLITPAVIRQWASDGTRFGQLAKAQEPTGATGDDGEPVMRIRRFKGRTLYPIAATRAYAQALYGAPVQLGSPRSVTSPDR